MKSYISGLRCLRPKWSGTHKTRPIYSWRK